MYYVAIDYYKGISLLLLPINHSHHICIVYVSHCVL